MPASVRARYAAGDQIIREAQFPSQPVQRRFSIALRRFASWRRFALCRNSATVGKELCVARLPRTKSVGGVGFSLTRGCAESGSLNNHLRSRVSHAWLNLASQHSIQIESRADQCEMGKGLGKVAQRLALRPCLLCIKPKMIRVSQHTFKQQTGLIQFFGICLTGARQRFHEPKGAHVERALLTRESVNTG